MDKIKTLLKRFEKWIDDINPITDIAEKYKQLDEWMLNNVWNLGLSDDEKKQIKQDFADLWNEKIALSPDDYITGEDIKVSEDIDTTTRSLPGDPGPDLLTRSRAGKDPNTPNNFSDELMNYGIPEKAYFRLMYMFGVNPSKEAINNWLSDPNNANSDVGLHALAYLDLMTGDVLMRPAYRNGVPVLLDNGVQALEPFESHFGGVKVEDFIDTRATPDEINRWQTYLEENNIVPDNYFAESRGQMSEKLRASIKFVMNWIDTNRYVVEGTDTYNSIMEKGSVYFTSASATYDEADYHRNLLAYGLEEMAKEFAILDDVEEAKIAKELAKQYIPPSKESLQDMTEAWFQEKLGRKPTAEELNDWSTKFADSYSESYKEGRAALRRLNDYNFMQSQPEYLDAQDKQVALSPDFSPNEQIDLSMFSSQTPEEIMTGKLEGEFGKQIDAVEQGRKVRKLQSDLLTYMFGR